MNNTAIVLLMLIIVFLITIYIYKLRIIYNYWKDRGIIGPTPLPILGNYASVLFFKESEADLLRKLYEKYPKEKYIGIFKGIHPTLLIRDLNIIKRILVKDFDCFNVRCIEKPISVYNHSLYVMPGEEKWKNFRSIFSRGLSTSRIAMMLPKINESLQKYLTYINNLTESHTRFDIRNINNKYVLDIFSKLIFGQDMKVYSDSTFEKTILETIHSKLNLSLLQIINLTNPAFLNPISGLIFTKFDNFHSIFHNLITSLVLKLTNHTEENKIRGDCFLNFLVVLKEKGVVLKDIKNTYDIDDDFIVQQTMTFFLAAFESISNTLTFLMHELSQNQDVQAKCIEEVDNIVNKNNGNITAETLTEMIYLQTVVDETLRKHPITNGIDRKCVRKCIFNEENLTIDQGISILIPVHGIHYDFLYFSNPEAFCPERFSPENKANLKDCSFLPFSEGPRMCIGSRLAKAVILCGIFGFLCKFKVQPITADLKLVYEPRRIRALTPSKKTPIWLKVGRRTK